MNVSYVRDLHNVHSPTEDERQFENLRNAEWNGHRAA